MKSKFKIYGLLIIVCLSICAVFAGCLTEADYDAIYNDDSKIATSSSSTSIGQVQMSTNGRYELSCTSFSGVRIIKDNFNVTKNTVANLSLKVEEGKFKVVLVNDKKVYTIAEGSRDGALDLSGIPDGKYNIKIVGVSAQISLTLTY